ncbi:ATP-binding protein [Peredibacter sp. HCB2-198]|uniref:ATP-binding protein n=1 Tax=Peredibacter sp. HCB2-198 TaxID=3383025 RepID=UPI0038B6413E
MYVDKNRFKLSWERKIALNVMIAILHVLSGKIGLLLSTHNSEISSLWPPSGLALAAVLTFGTYQVLPGLLTGILITSFQNFSAPITVIGVSASCLSETLIATLLLHSIGKGKFRFKDPKDIFQFICIAVFLAPFVSSTMSTTFMFMGGVFGTKQVPFMWFNLFVGNSLGILIFTPFLLTFVTRRERKTNYLEALILYVSLGFICYWAFEGQETKRFLVVPLACWAALRFGFRGVGLTTITMGFMVVWRSTHWVTTPDAPGIDLFWIQCLTFGTAIGGYFMATVVEAQEMAQEKELEYFISLEHKKVAEEALAILDQAIQKSPIGFALIDKQYRYIRVNAAFAQINGQPADWHLGRTLREMIPYISDVVEVMVNRVFETGQSLMNIPYQGNGNNTGKNLSGLVSYYPVKHPITEEIFGVAISYQDLTEHHRTQDLLKENEARLAFAQEAGRIGAFEWDMTTNKILWTSELECIYGLNSGEFGGTFESWMERIHAEDVQNFHENIVRVLIGESELNLQFRIVTKLHDVRWLLARGRMMRDSQGRGVKFIGINIDITDQKMTEQKLRVTEANLLHALSVRDEFMAIASHELKTPLTSLKLQIELYQRGVLKGDLSIYSPEKINLLLQRNSRQIDRLTRLVDDMLDISRIRTGKLTLKKEDCDLSEMLKDILNRTKEQFRVSGSGEPIVENVSEARGEWDPLRIDQVLTNIITNAIRYGQGKPITIKVKNYEESVRISVKDQGLGIAKSDQEKIFQRYERGLIAREVSGLGLGLFICQQIVEAHGGSIWVESEVNQGATFFVDLPRVCHSTIFMPYLQHDLIPSEN